MLVNLAKLVGLAKVIALPFVQGAVDGWMDGWMDG